MIKKGTSKATAMKEETAAAQESLPAFTKQQFLESKLFTAQQKDLLNALLHDEETYTTDQVKQQIEQYLKKAVE
ncbi:hypothetical protein [Paenibacillus ehimensis]|uniref:Uncharacterized protein n=1 Tax=Paenibacillus ehimensis TaxID=79264 RepID=A0ABT8VCG4_9BACL|nr:hypothetical protein [Paenibacillus ehimensis]MDO3678681.1 hypothetical protein [Paenibacillus ehimensis]MEC0212619.1 hypothetical protein [Paenibacillus ehimensis]